MQLAMAWRMTGTKIAGALLIVSGLCAGAQVPNV